MGDALLIGSLLTGGLRLVGDHRLLILIDGGLIDAGIDLKQRVALTDHLIVVHVESDHVA